jgi:hypothetical protein
MKPGKKRESKEERTAVCTYTPGRTIDFLFYLRELYESRKQWMGQAPNFGDGGAPDFSGTLFGICQPMSGRKGNETG